MEAEIAKLEVKDSLYNEFIETCNSQDSETTRDRLISIDSINDVVYPFRQENNESDSASSFRIPINARHFQSEYLIKIGYSDITKKLTVSYTLEDTVINNRITKSAKNLQIIDPN